MPFNKNKKDVKQRGSKSHGSGIKKNRGAGNRGGRGMAGSGKRADQKKPTILKLYGKKYFGHYGFKRPQKTIVEFRGFNVGRLDELSLDKKENGKFVVDISKLGCNKLLAKGDITQDYKVIADYASAKAIEKIEAKGGEVVLKFNKKEEEVNEE